MADDHEDGYRGPAVLTVDGGRYRVTGVGLPPFRFDG